MANISMVKWLGVTCTYLLVLTESTTKSAKVVDWPETALLLMSRLIFVMRNEPLVH